ncbi:hypothetical protein SHDE107825_08340 [Shewanella denitrificans]|jgi:hypothetical protein
MEALFIALAINIYHNDEERQVLNIYRMNDKCLMLQQHVEINRLNINKIIPFRFY